MAKAEWGVKRLCPHCGARYYDMKKKPPLCPQCGTALDLDAAPKVKRARPVIEEKPIKNKPVPMDMDDDVDLAARDEDEATVIEDADELGEDALDVEDVVELDEKEEV